VGLIYGFAYLLYFNVKSFPQGQAEQTKDFTLKYKRYAKPYMSPTGTNRTNKGLHIKVQEVCKAACEPHRDKQNKQRTSH
jgi:hypothetical protein